MGKFFGLSLFILVLMAGVWEVFTAHRLPGTSRDARYFGYGHTPAVCMDRARRNFEALQGPMSDVAALFESDPSLASVHLVYGDPVALEVEQFQSEDDGMVTAEDSYAFLEGEDANRHPAMAPLTRLADSRNLFRPWMFRRPHPTDPLRADTFISCGSAAWRWPFFVLGYPRNLPFLRASEATPVGHFFYQYGPGDGDLPVCEPTVPELRDDYVHLCLAPLQSDWFIRQAWIDYRAMLDAQSAPAAGDPDYSGT